MRPEDYLEPDWSNIQKCHDWKTYATQDLRDHWLHMSEGSRMVVSECLQNIADAEEWE